MPTPRSPAVSTRAAMLARAGRGDYWRWLAHIQTAAACTRPVRLAGTVHSVDTRTGDVWNASASELWRRTTIAIGRALTRHARLHGGRVRVSFGKVAEYQRRGVVHYHALIRLDGIDPDDRDSHAGRLIDAAWIRGRDPGYRALRRWAHTLGYGGHFFTKSRRYTGTFTAERQRRIAGRRTRAATSRLQRAGAHAAQEEQRKALRSLGDRLT